MKCAICRESLNGKHYIVDVRDVLSGEYHVMHCCGHCAIKLAEMRPGARYHISWRTQRASKNVASIPLRLLEKAQVNGLF